MKQLYLTILDALKQIPAIKWVDLNTGQLQQEMPPLAYPAVLINVNSLNCKDLGENTQRVQASFSLTLVYPTMGETNSHAPEPMQSTGLQFLDLAEEIYKKMQGFESEQFYPFECTGVQFRNLRGLNTVELQFATAFEDYTAS
ncbi:hypothetical protein [Capnocytophaga felis]|uniref:Uncharacterized protein n=1 Tax=Capnocytophaga felis TaxID=2267611 RepID=A0A5M4BB73_9FLAO|nr:hypothetical protein [Capnocytophaga felis]GET46487.1 hypothetical protein RCZ01_17890 [Capnocytophaga felis]GET48377.1 hypothetical protein RCZ02_12080 [Capnocytophaga felis]